MKPKTKPTKLPYIGFQISPEMDQCIRLHGYYHNISISQILRSVTREWLKDSCVTERTLIESVMMKADEKWEKRRFVDPSAGLSVFLGEWKGELEKKVPRPLVIRIIEEWNGRNLLK